MLPKRWSCLKMWEIAPNMWGENGFFYKSTWSEIWNFSNTAYLSVEKGSWRNRVRWLHAFPGCHSVETSPWILVSKWSCIAIRRFTKHAVTCGNAPLGTRLVGRGWETVQWVNPQKLTLALLTVGRREGESDSNRNEKTKSGHRTPPMPKFLCWLWQTLLVQHKALYMHCTSHQCGKTRTVGNIYSFFPEGDFILLRPIVLRQRWA